MPAPGDPASSALDAVLAATIRAEGPISIARFMALALNHPEHGYYQRRDALSADFTTAPESSQMFGELVALWLAQAWQELGRPSPLALIELGPGRGTMMADMMRALQAVPELRSRLKIHLVEASEPLRQAQGQRLAGLPVTWHERLDTVPSTPFLLVANEFLDVLPVHQLVRTKAGWVERRVGLGPDGRLCLIDDRTASPLAEGVAGDAASGTIAEVAPARAALVRAIAARLHADPGVALLVDYGAWAMGPTGDTLQAMRHGQPWPPLEAPGTADLSTQVDFRAVARAAAAAGARSFGPVPQGPFLRALGVEARAVALMRGASPEQRHRIRHGLFRLTDAGAMGELFKVMALTGPDAPPPPGFSASPSMP